MNHKDSFDASASMAGYVFQCRLALLRGLQLLKKHPNALISIEKFDDVAFEDDDYGTCLIQAKHHVTPKSLADKSVDLWKTIRVWLESFQQGSLTSSNVRRMLITTAEAVDGSAMAKLRPGHSADDRKAARDLLRAAAESSENQTTKQGRELLLKLSDSEVDLFLGSIEVCDRHPNLIDMNDDIEGELVLLSPQHVSTIAQYLEGWWFSVVGKHLVEENSDLIPIQSITIKANEIGNMFKDDGLPVDDPELLDAKDYTPDDEDAVFVRQMRVVGLSDKVVRRGVRDFYRSSAQRSKWARESLLLDGESDRYDTALQDRWGRKFDEGCAEGGGESEDEKRKLGRSIYFWASQEQVGFRNVVETWITAGSFHGLSDRMEIGWHPDFKEILVPEDA